jgi:uncharacterized protein YciI
MLFAIICTDKPGSLQLRTDRRPDHRSYLEALNSQGAIAFSGPFVSAEGSADGSMIVVDVEDLAAASAIAENDPYSQCGLFQDVQIRQWIWGMNAPAPK